MGRPTESGSPAAGARWTASTARASRSNRRRSFRSSPASRARPLTRLRTATPDCEIDAGGLPVTWLDGVKADESAAWLNSLVSGTPSTGERYDRIARPALVALAMHEGAVATRSLVAIARDHAVSKMRSDALFWLGQRAGDQAVVGHRGSDRSRSGHRGQEEGGVRAEPAAERRGRAEADRGREEQQERRGAQAGDVLARAVERSEGAEVLRGRPFEVVQTWSLGRPEGLHYLRARRSATNPTTRITPADAVASHSARDRAGRIVSSIFA